MRKKIGLFICAAALFWASGVHAENVKISDMKNSIITIEGKADSDLKFVNILILKGGTDLKAAEAEPEKFIVYQGEAEVDNKGNYSKSIRVRADVYSEFDVYFGSDMESVAIAPISEKITKAKEIATLDVEKIKVILDDEYSRKVLGINTEIVKNADIDWLAKKVSENLTALDLDNENQDIVISELEKINDVTDEYALISCYNEEAKVAIFNGDEILRNDILDLDANSTVLQCYNDVLDKTGKANVLKGILEKDYNNLQELRSEYAKQILFEGIKNDVNVGGGGHINILFTEDNVELADLDIPKYMALSNTKKAIINSKLIADNSLTLSNLEEKIEKYASEKITGAGSGSGGGGGSPSATIPGAGVTASGSGITVSKPETEITPDDAEGVVYDDIDNVLWAKEAIYYLNEKGIMSGVGNNKFSPNTYLTREQAVKIICEMKGLEIIESKSDFKDVDPNAWYAKYVSTAVKNGITNGFSAEIFGVGIKISRQDFVTMIYRSLEEKTEFMGVIGFEDSKEIEGYAKDAVGYFVEKGIISGYGDNTFKPTGNITRAEAAKIVYAIIKEELQ